MKLGLEGKVALVLASSKGLGFACAKEFYREGANVMISSRSIENLKRAKDQIQSSDSLSNDNQVLHTECDLNNEEDIKNLVETTIEKFGRIDILVHNAGGPPSGNIERISSEQWERSIQLNLQSLIRICREVIPIMQQQRQGRIIAITSVSVKQPLENLVLSNTTRLGVVGFAKTLANEYAKDGLLVNVVCPGPTLTNRMEELIEAEVRETSKSKDEVMQKWTNQIPMRRLGKPEELANLVVFLASERASYITGTCIQVDGGFVKSPF